MSIEKPLSATISSRSMSRCPLLGLIILSLLRRHPQHNPLSRSLPRLLLRLLIRSGFHLDPLGISSGVDRTVPQNLEPDRLVRSDSLIDGRIQPHGRRAPSRLFLDLPPALNGPVEQPSCRRLALPLRISHTAVAHDQVPLIAFPDVLPLQTFGDHPSDITFKGHRDAPQPAQAKSEKRREQSRAPCDQWLKPRRSGMWRKEQDDSGDGVGGRGGEKLGVWCGGRRGGVRGG